MFQGERQDSGFCDDSLYTCSDKSNGLHILERPYTSMGDNACGHNVCEEMVELSKQQGLPSFECPNENCEAMLIVGEMQLNKALEKEILKQRARCMNEGCTCVEKSKTVIK